MVKIITDRLYRAEKFDRPYRRETSVVCWPDVSHGLHHRRSRPPPFWGFFPLALPVAIVSLSRRTAAVGGLAMYTGTGSDASKERQVGDCELVMIPPSCVRFQGKEKQCSCRSNNWGDPCTYIGRLHS